MLIAYGKGARTFERHIDIDCQDVPVSKYCSLPEQTDTWFKAFKKAEEMCGGAGSQKRVVSKKETEYLEDLVRGVYAKFDLKAGKVLTQDDVFLAIPLQKGQISCREFRTGEVMKSSVKKGDKITISDIQTAYGQGGEFIKYINRRGI
jgi:N-acetylneuraminate synthase